MAGSDSKIPYVDVAKIRENLEQNYKSEKDSFNRKKRSANLPKIPLKRSNSNTEKL